jgi:hypothetical protein
MLYTHSFQTSLADREADVRGFFADSFEVVRVDVLPAAVPERPTQARLSFRMRRR